MRIISFNANGIRSAGRKGFFNWLKAVAPDVVCIQETKAQREQLTDPMFTPDGYHCYYVDAEKKGYSGVALYSRVAPDNVHDRFGWKQADSEGRFIQVDYKDVSVISLYLPSGTSGDARQAIKMDFLEKFEQKLKKIKQSGKSFIICGDLNIAHKKIDLKNWRGNQKNSGFLPEERAFLDKVFGELGFHDAFRVLNREEDQFTWWSNRGQAWAKNVGWRIDYQVITPELAPCLITTHIYKDERFSDHAPLLIDYDLELK